MRWRQELELAERASRQAGAILRELRDKDKTVLSSVGKDIKLQADRDAEAGILELLAGSAYPVLAEESGAHGIIGGADPYWVVDPLDGTLNFSRGVPMSCVSVALCEGARAVLGVIHDFNREECFSGIASEGAWLNGVPMTVSGIDDAARAVLATGFPTKRTYSTDSLNAFVEDVQRFKKIRMFGSAALSLAYVACGRVDAYAEDDIMLWDVAAGIAIVQGAGGFVAVCDSPSVEWGKVVRCGSHAGIWPDCQDGGAQRK